MADLPRIGGPRHVAAPRRAIVSDRSGAIIGDALERTGAAVAHMGAVRQEREDRFNYARAKSALLKADIEARAELERDQDYETHEQRYSERMKKARDAANALIRSESDRALFGQDADLDIARGTQAIRGNARTIEVDRAMADLSGILETNRAAALQAKDEPTRTAIINNSLEAIGGARAKYGDRLSETEAAKLRQQWTHDYAEGYMTMLGTAERVAVLSKPEGTPAQFLQPDERAKLLEQALAEDKEVRLRAGSQSESDAIMAKYSDRGEALAAARKISDPELRDATTTRVNARFAEIAAIDAERNDKAFTAAATSVEQSGSIDGIDPRTWQTVLTQPQRQSLEERAKQLRDGIPVKTDQAVWYEIRLEAVNDPNAFVSRNLMFDRPSLGDADFQELADLQARMRVGDGSADKLLSGIRTRQQVVDGALREMGIDYGDSASVEQNTRANEFRRKVDDKVLDLQRLTGKEATAEDVQKITDGLILEVDVPKAWWPDSRTRVFESDELSSIPTKDLADIERALRRRNLPVTDAAILQLYNDGLAIE